ncbi:hypothetical protein Clacol_001942 [Clathrus columnatus]|uniref:Rho GDP-dissociation inhibitor n=1 Tax=Clathrus columnatus TaxID=1419009 RepID=A0AAV5A2R2_9AGAM|nr:hypothetical protein Clacol_001942 [Clathrus columnatus]
MSTSQHDDQDDLAPTQTTGYKVGQLKSVEDYKNLDANDESLNRWKASLGLDKAAATENNGPKITVLTLFLESDTLPPGKTLSLDPNDTPLNWKSTRKSLSVLKKVSSTVNHTIATGIRYIQVVKRAGIKLDKFEQMLGSFAPAADGKPYVKPFDPEESPSGILARSGTYSVRSRVIDDDNNIYCDFEWAFKITKEW